MSLSRPLTAFIAGLIISAATQAATNVSAQYDGVYTGVAKPNPAVSVAGPCAPFTINKVTIRQGNLKSDAVTTAAAINGIITEDGYVQAKMALPGGAPSEFDGRLTGSTISAGFIESSSGCAWLVELKREG